MLDQFFSMYHRSLSQKPKPKVIPPPSQQKQGPKEEAKLIYNDNNNNKTQKRLFEKNLPDDEIRKWTHADSGDYDLHKLGYYWPTGLA